MLIGKRISGRYKILEVIGGGGMANVYLARDIILERDVAIKILRLDFANNDEFIRRFRREAQSATSLDHPNIVSIYDVGEEDDIYYIVMEYVKGQTLKQYIQQNAPLDPREALKIMEQIVSAIAHAHYNQIVHRDIKPHNILIDNVGNIKVTDFGIAMALTSTTITHTNSVLGSVHYLSPEQARGQIATKKSDIYSLGIVLYEMLTGRLPFDGESAVSIALKHLQAEAPSAKRWNPDIPQSVENIILKAMAKDPTHRYSSAEEMAEDIRTAFDADRLNEQKFTIPNDEEKTITHPILFDDIKDASDETIIHHPNDRPQGPDNHQVQDEKENKPKRKKRKWWKILLIAAVVFIVAIMSALFVLPKFFLPRDIEIPDVSGKKYEEAVQLLLEEGLKVNDPILLENDEVEEGYVIRTEPEAGSIVKEGSAVTIYESLGKEKETLDNYIGQDIERVRNLLETKGFTNITVLEEYSDEEEGTIIDQSPEEGAELVPDEDEITLTVSKGPRKISIADLTGYSEGAVKAYVNEQNLSLTTKQEHSDTVPEGQVISQSPKAGEEVLPGEQIEVVFSLGPEEKPNKTVVKEVDIPFDPAVYGEEAEASIYINDANHSIDKPIETFKISAPTTRKIELEIKPDQSAYYQVFLNNQLLKTETVSYPED